MNLLIALFVYEKVVNPESMYYCSTIWYFFMNRLMKETRIERDWNKMDTVTILQSIGLNLLFYKQNVIDKNVLFIVYKKYFYFNVY